MNDYDDKKYVSCKNCGCELEADQRKCPYCKTINQSAPKRTPNLLLIVSLLVICAIAGAVAVVLVLNNG